MKQSIGGTKLFESSRFFWVQTKLPKDSGWYYEAREGTFGPFPTQLAAEWDLVRLMEENPRQRTDRINFGTVQAGTHAVPGF